MAKVNYNAIRHIFKIWYQIGNIVYIECCESKNYWTHKIYIYTIYTVKKKDTLRYGFNRDGVLKIFKQLFINRLHWNQIIN